MAEVPAPVGLGGVERRVQAESDERVLERRARARVRVNVAGRNHTGKLKLVPQPLKAPVAGSVAGQIGALQFNPQMLSPEALTQHAQRRLVVNAA